MTCLGTDNCITGVQAVVILLLPKLQTVSAILWSRTVLQMGLMIKFRPVEARDEQQRNYRI